MSDSFATTDGREVALGIYVEPGKADRASYAMEALKRSMRWDEERFGRVYDLDVFNIVAVSDFNLGAMENKGLNIFNDKYILASPETTTDEDYARIEAIIAHEYLHNWSGNRVTCRDWFQLCLKEGLTVFRDQEFTSDLYDRTVKRIEDVRDLWALQFPEDAGPLAHPVRPDSYREINNFYTATVYEKGAEIVRMIFRWLGSERFRKGLDRYFRDHDGQAVRVEEFLASMEAEADGLGRWPDFLSWYTQAGTPHVKVAVRADDTAGSLNLAFEQVTRPTPGQSTKTALPIPCALALIDRSGANVAINADQVHAEGGRLAGSVFLLEEACGQLKLSGLPQGRILPSLFGGYSAPVRVETTGLSRDDKLQLASHDPDPFNRWAHLQGLTMEALQRRYTRIGLGEPQGDDGPLFAAMLDAALERPLRGVGDEALRSALVRLPSAQDVARSLGTDVDPERVETARQSLAQDMISEHGKRVAEALNAAGFKDDGAITPQAAAERSLILELMTLLVRGHHPDAAPMIAQLHAGARGMTVRLRSLRLLLESDHPDAEPALTAFEHRFGSDPLAMDKWFAVQAATLRQDIPSRIAALEAHPAYQRLNPNRVRALLGSFCAGNLTGFHTADGSGYRLLTDRLAEIDPANPQLAARLAAGLRSWQIFDAKRQAQAKAAMNALFERDGLSPDLKDMLDRMLAV